MVSGNFFGELGITPVYGRLLDEQDDKAGSPPVAVLGYGYWQSRFGGDPGIVMKTIRLNDKPVQVVGIAPSQFGGLVRQPTRLDAELAVPLSDGRRPRAGRITGYSGPSWSAGSSPGSPSRLREAQFRSLTAELRESTAPVR